jgi:hypothetical protein
MFIQNNVIEEMRINRRQHPTCWKRADASHGKNESLVLIIWLYAKLEAR